MKNKIKKFISDFDSKICLPNYKLKEYLKNIDDLTQENFFKSPGHEHYTLLTHLSYQFENEVLYDIGTFRGLSALALSSNSKNKVISYDIKNTLEITLPENVFFTIGNFYDDPGLLGSPLIFFDVDPHGEIEKIFIDYLVKNNYNGIVIFDDIRSCSKLMKIWDSITVEKIDITNIGHASGTGIVFFE